MQDLLVNCPHCNAKIHGIRKQNNNNNNSKKENDSNNLIYVDKGLISIYTNEGMFIQGYRAHTETCPVKFYKVKQKNTRETK